MATIWIVLRSFFYATVFLLLWGWIAYWAHLQAPPRGMVLPGWTTGPGVALMVAGAALILACVATFAVQGRGTPAPFDAPRRLVARGPYRWVRNPMYIGAFVLFLGYALCGGSVPALIVAFAMLAMAHLFVVFYEEPHLEKLFGESYLAYKRSTPRWIPRPPS